ncbi:MAG TPA: GNAT family N-acetyltransferase [Gemmatimonadaceae bacterium]
MVDYLSVFRSDIAVAEPLLRQISDGDAGVPLAPGKWSRKQVLGHLIDSASVNHERFVRARQLEDLVFPGYDQDVWVEAQRYADADWEDLIELWLRFNRHLVAVMDATPEAERCRHREHHNFDVIAFRAVSADLPSTLDYLMKDYVVHLEHHLTQILGDGWAFRDSGSEPPAGKFVLGTDRLELRELTPDDLPFVAEMVGDAQTMRFYPHRFMPLEARYWLQRQLNRYARDGHGLWLVVERASGARVGQVGLSIQDVDGKREPEIGWLIHRRYWRRGYATEAGRAVRDRAFTTMGLGRVISLIRPENEPSRGVAKKVGMVVERETDFHGYRHLVHVATRT